MLMIFIFALKFFNQIDLIVLDLGWLHKIWLSPGRENQDPNVHESKQGEGGLLYPSLPGDQEVQRPRDLGGMRQVGH